MYPSLAGWSNINDLSLLSVWPLLAHLAMKHQLKLMESGLLNASNNVLPMTENHTVTLKSCLGEDHVSSVNLKTDQKGLLRKSPMLKISSESWLWNGDATSYIKMGNTKNVSQRNMALLKLPVKTVPHKSEKIFMRWDILPRMKKKQHLENITERPQIIVAYFNDLSAWSKAHGSGALRACPNALLLV